MLLAAQSSLPRSLDTMLSGDTDDQAQHKTAEQMDTVLDVCLFFTNLITKVTNLCITWIFSNTINLLTST